MGDGPIPWVVAMQYADRIGMDSAEADIFWHIISQLDDTWLAFQKSKAATNGSGKKAK